MPSSGKNQSFILRTVHSCWNIEPGNGVWLEVGILSLLRLILLAGPRNPIEHNISFLVWFYVLGATTYYRSSVTLWYYTAAVSTHRTKYAPMQATMLPTQCTRKKEQVHKQLKNQPPNKQPISVSVWMAAHASIAFIASPRKKEASMP